MRPQGPARSTSARAGRACGRVRDGASSCCGLCRRLSPAVLSAAGLNRRVGGLIWPILKNYRHRTPQGSLVATAAAAAVLPRWQSGAHRETVTRAGAGSAGHAERLVKLRIPCRPPPPGPAATGTVSVGPGADPRSNAHMPRSWQRPGSRTKSGSGCRLGLSGRCHFVHGFRLHP